ncbi:hypothetical protein [Desulfonatronum thiosulfatophilum]|uniref:hypothetical protein n=1 Tax=Desulfonatronum thiosulfatophilum TaxID=617002 RepID=UPI001428D092|nr:hypothetical protein [Desulfonatronum thiosulfatophilum]
MSRMRLTGAIRVGSPLLAENNGLLHFIYLPKKMIHKQLVPSPITHHPSPITHHPSPITHHPSPITHHPSPITQI